MGIDEQGREIISYIEGYVPASLGMWSDNQLITAAKFIHRFHDVTAGSNIAGNGEVVCHNDLSPCNFVFVNDKPVAIIDFDAASPGSRVSDLAYAAWLWLDIGNDEITPEEQKRRLNLFAEAYGYSDIESIINMMMSRQKLLLQEGLNRGKSCLVNWTKGCLEWTEKYLITF